MPIAHVSLPGLDRERLLAAVEPVLAVHGVAGVELHWRSDRGERVLELTLERPGVTEPGGGITIDVCTDVSRDLSVALDVADAIGGRYRLEVGSPGVERALYRAEDYARFEGCPARLRLAATVEGERVLRGVLRGLDPQGAVLLETPDGVRAYDLTGIESARLLFEYGTRERPRPPTGAGARAKGRGKTPRAPQRKR